VPANIVSPFRVRTEELSYAFGPTHLERAAHMIADIDMETPPSRRIPVLDSVAIRAASPTTRELRSLRRATIEPHPGL
jgi:hypothetical protein